MIWLTPVRRSKLGDQQTDDALAEDRDPFAEPRRRVQDDVDGRLDVGQKDAQRRVDAGRQANRHRRRDDVLD